LRLKLTLSSEEDYINLPLHYNFTLQGMLYKSLPKFLSEFLHDVGFFYNGRRFKLYTFSKIQSPHFKIYKDTKRISFKTPITIFISSTVNEITRSLGETFLKKDIIKLGKNELYLEEIEILTNPKIENTEIKIKTLSPITAYQTFEKENNRKFYKYYNPSQPQFNELIKENARKKYEILTGKNVNKEDFPFEIKPLNTKKTLIKYKNFMVEGYDGEFLVKTKPEILKTIYDAGLGAKNSQGFGMIEVYNG